MKEIYPIFSKSKGFFVGDIVLMIFSFFISYYIRYSTFSGSVDNKQLYLLTYILGIWIILLVLYKPYKETFNKYELGNMLAKWLFFLLLQLSLISIYWTAIQEISYSRLRLAIYFAVLFFLGAFFRVAYLNILRFVHKKGFLLKRYMILGEGFVSNKIIEYYKYRPENGFKFSGFLDGVFSSNGQEGIIQRLKQEKIEYIYCCLPHTNYSLISQLQEISQHTKTELKLIIDYDVFLKKGLAIEYNDFIPIINVSTKVNDSVSVQKRIFDLCFTVLALPFALPFFIICSLVTKLSSKGSIIYKSERIGHWGKKFYIYKFRSMYENADEIAAEYLNGDFHSVGDLDPRITAWGKFMRKTRMDELPQFYNILKGDISVVGPRPLPVYDMDMIKSISPLKHNLLLSMKPGLTSLGQIKFGYASDAKENMWRLNYDLLYKDKNSLILDIWIIAQTVKVVLQAKGK